jgi:hypothetical protein
MRWLLILLWFVPSLALAQVNVEKVRSGGINEGFSGSAALSSAFSTGNIQLADIGLSASEAYKRGDHTVFSVLNGRFAAKRTQADLKDDPKTGLWDKDARFANAFMAHLRYNYALTEAVWLEVFAQYEFNEFLLLDRRLVTGIGPRLGLLKGKHGLIVLGTAAMVEEERLNSELVSESEAVQRINMRSSSYLSGTWRPKDGISWTTTVYMQPRFDQFSDYRLLAETGLSLSISKRFSFTADVRYKLDSQPPETPDGNAEVLPADVTVKNGIKVTW